MDEFVRIKQHLLALGFKTQMVNVFVKDIKHSVTGSGVEWFVKRFKSLKQYHLSQLMDSSFSTIPPGWKVLKTRTRTVFHDPMVRLVMDLPNEGKSLLRKEGFLRLHQVFKLKDISDDQYAKFWSNVTGPYSGTEEALDMSIKLVTNGFTMMHSTLSKKSNFVLDSDFLPLRIWSPCEKGAPQVEFRLCDPDGLTTVGIRIRSASRMKVETHNFMRYMVRDEALNRHWHRNKWTTSHAFIGEGEVIPYRPLLVDGMNLPAGTIGFLQEGGCKLRTVANPFLCIQALGEPAKRRLESLCKLIPQIGTFDQDECHTQIVKWLSQGKTVSSYDLTAFTDRFPYEIQKEVLFYLVECGYILESDKDLFDLIVTKEWKLPGLQGSIRWEVGQPLGFGPSFHLATLTHHLLLQGMGSTEHLVVGDDIVINDLAIAERYEQLLLSLGVEISRSKSIVSNLFAEFCGKLLSPEGVNPSTKVKLVTHGDQLVRLVDYYGPSIHEFLSPCEREWVFKVMLPKSLGGLGIALPGQTYEDYLCSLRTGTIAEAELIADLAKALGSSQTTKDTRAMWDWLEAFDADNDLTTGSVGGASFSPSGVNGVSATNHFPNGFPKPRGRGDLMEPYRSKTYIALRDDLARVEISQKTRLPQSTKHHYFCRHGYLDNVTGISPATTFHWRTNNDDKKRQHQSYTHYFETERAKLDREEDENPQGR